MKTSKFVKSNRPTNTNTNIRHLDGNYDSESEDNTDEVNYINNLKLGNDNKNYEMYMNEVSSFKLGNIPLHIDLFCDGKLLCW